MKIEAGANPLFFVQINNILKFHKVVGCHHSWAQWKLSPLSRLNILLSINGPLLSLGFND